MENETGKIDLPLNKSESLIEQFVRRFEYLILTGKIAIGKKLPSERDLAEQLGVGRQVVHEGLLDLAAKGLVTMKPRAGAVVNDYHKDGSLFLVQSFLNFHDRKLHRGLWRDLMQLRMLVECESARLAATNRTEEQLTILRDIARQEKDVSLDDAKKVAHLNFAFHHTVALASGNTVFPLLMNAVKELIKNPDGRFYKNPNSIKQVFSLHAEMALIIQDGDGKRASSLMRRILEGGFERPQTVGAEDGLGAVAE